MGPLACTSKPSKGITLIELLIAITILIFVLGLGSMAYSQFRDYWTDKVGQFDHEFEQAKGISQLLYTIKNVQPFIIKDTELKAFHYFEGAETLMRGVVFPSMQDKNQYAAFEIYLETTRERKNQLYYREQLFEESVLLYESDLGSYGEPHLLMEDFTGLQFEFYGFKHVFDWFEANENPLRAQRQWFGAYSGKDTKIIPESVRIRFSINDSASELVVPMRRFSADQYEFYSNEVE